MQIFTEHRPRFRPHCVPLQRLGVLLLAGILSACGGGGTSGNGQNVASLSGNWQFTVASPSDQSFLGGLQGGFLLQNNGSITGGAVYSVSLPAQSGGNPIVCNSGSAPITGTVTGQNVSLTAVAGTQTFTFTGMLNTNRTTMVGTYTSTAGTASDGTACGTVQTGLQWSAFIVPPLNGTLQGSFHSTNGPLSNQDFPVSLSLTQGENIGASNATLSGILSFIDPTTLLSDYPCFDTASVNGQISGNSLILQIIGTNGSTLGQIGGSFGSGLSPVTYDSTQYGYILHSAAGTAYAVSSKACPGGGSVASPGDSGNICLALSTSPKACQQPVALSPAFLAFPPQTIGSTPTSQTITLANNSPSGSILNGLELQLSISNGSFGGPSDFNGLPNFTEQDNCASSLGSTFFLDPGQFCSITITFAPQESCPWLPYGNPPSFFGAPPSLCPFPLSALLTVNSPSSADNDTAFAVPITGPGISAITASTTELDFGSEALSQASLPQLISFTNHSPNPVQILGRAPCLNNPPSNGSNTLPHPLQASSPVAGLQVVANGVGSVGGSITPNGSTIIYSCDSDPTTLIPNFQISSDTCTGTLLTSQGTCSLDVTFAPQAGTPINSGLDFFLELNTVQCAGSVESNCEVDSGRFPVELKASPATPLRLSPAAGIDFGNQAVGHSSGQQKLTLFNDPADPNSATINFVGKVVVSGDYSESDDCPLSLAPGAICTLTVTFKPKVVGPDPGTLTINYTPELTGNPQVVYLRGTGQ
jgi:hypothetical protein